MAKRVVLDCDVCGSEGAHPVVIAIEASAWRVELCATCQATRSIDEVKQYGTETVLTNHTRGGRSAAYEKVTGDRLLAMLQREQEGR